jgi:periplasmic copper chaperone A
VMKPGSMHVMLIGLKHPLARGDSFPLTLRFEKAGEQTVSVHVEKIGAMEMPGMPGMDGGMKGMSPGTTGGH